MTNEGYELIPDNYELFHLRTVHYYHGLFIGLITVSAILYYAITRKKPDLVLEIILFGGLITMASAILYGYITQTPIFHGLFIFGLSVVFTGGLFHTYQILENCSQNEQFTRSLNTHASDRWYPGGGIGFLLYGSPSLSGIHICGNLVSDRPRPR